MSFNGFRRFLRDTAGNYAIIFALAAFPIMGTVSLAVEYSSIQRQRGAVQQALDAAALAAAKEFSSGVTGSTLDAYARDYFEALLPDYIDPDKIDLSVNLVDETVTDSGGEPADIKTVRLNAMIDYKSSIAGVVGFKDFDIGVMSQVALGNITVEVALVMDNSGSMGSNSKLTLAKSTAKQLVDTIFAAGSNSNKSNPVSFSLVPFAAMVNIGTSNAGEEWMDTNGWSPMHWENLNWKTYISSNTTQQNNAGFREKINNQWQWLSRFTFYDMMGIDWTGCVEMRPWPYNTNDVSVTSGTPSSGVTQVSSSSKDSDRAALYVPIFAPDEPDSSYTYQSGSRTRKSKDWYSYSNNYAYDWKRPKPSNPSQTEQLYYDDGFQSYNFQDFNYSAGVIQSKQNVRQDWIWRYQADSFGSSDSGSSKGPNYGCTTKAVTALTASKTSIKNSIDGMVANGNTNIQSGVAWGWRTLSPQVPFTGGRESSDETNRKYMIVLTDGNNTYSTSSTPNETTYAAWGYGKHNRIEEGLTASDLASTPYVGVNLNTFEKKMNAHTVQTCNNAKADGVTVFTIAFDVSNGSSVKSMLEACAGSGIVKNKLVMSSGTFYFDVSTSGLQQAMADIASQISELRIMR